MYKHFGTQEKLGGDPRFDERAVFEVSLRAWRMDAELRQLI